jgi:K+-sensing histidine kinase KdpD
MNGRDDRRCPPDVRHAGPGVSSRLLALVLRPTAPPLWLGICVAAGFITAETLLVYVLRRVAPGNAFGALFLLGVLVVSAAWGLRLAVVTSLVSAVVYVYFHLEMSGTLIPMHAGDAMAVIVFLPVALLANLLAGQARLRAAESEQRRRDADLGAELARLMLRSGDLDTALDSAGRRIAEVLGLRFALLSRETAEPSAHQVAVPLVDGYALLGTLLIPADVTKAQQQQARRLVPSLELLLAAASDREAINTALQGSRRDLERFFDVTSDLLYIGGGA